MDGLRHRLLWPGRRYTEFGIVWFPGFMDSDSVLVPGFWRCRRRALRDGRSFFWSAFRMSSLSRAARPGLLSDALLVDSDPALLKMNHEVQTHAFAGCGASFVAVQLPEAFVDGQAQL